MHLPTLLATALTTDIFTPRASADFFNIIEQAITGGTSPPVGTYLTALWSNDHGQSFPVNVYPGCRNPGVPGVVDACFDHTPSDVRAHFITTTGAKRCFQQTVSKHYSSCYVMSNCHIVFARWPEVTCTW
jgi:hypothetical protein